MFSKRDSALIIVGHGSTVNPDSSTPTFEHALEIQRRGVFGEVHCAFWKEEPSLRQVLHSIDRDEIYVVPNFISEGYFTRTVIPRELGLDGPTTRRGGQVIKYCEPTGSHPRMTELLLRRAAEVAEGVPPAETSLFIVGHGTDLNDNSAVAAKREVQLIRERRLYAEVLNAYMEEEPLIAQWDVLASQPNIVVVPFFISDGLHSYQDIPVLLGIEQEPTAAASQREIFRQNPHRLRGRTLYYSSAIGTEPLFAEVIIDQVAASDAQQRRAAADQPATEQGTSNGHTRGGEDPTIVRAGGATAVATAPLAKVSGATSEVGSAGREIGELRESLVEWLETGYEQIGQVAIRRMEDGGIELRHVEDRGRCDLELHTSADDAREIATLDDAGVFRPLKTAPNLRHGWRLVLEDVTALQQALDAFYPAMLGVLRSHEREKLTPVPLRETLARQSGMYAVTRKITDQQADAMIGSFCTSRGGCLKTILWQISSEAPVRSLPPSKFDPAANQSGAAAHTIPMLCHEACNLLIAQAREVVKSATTSD